MNRPPAWLAWLSIFALGMTIYLGNSRIDKLQKTLESQILANRKIGLESRKLYLCELHSIQQKIASGSSVLNCDPNALGIEQ